MSTQADQEIICKDCRTKFVFPVRDQEFFARMNFTPPVRCKPCRDKRKAAKESGGQPFNPPRQQQAAAAPAEPIREYKNRNPPPPPSRDDKNEGRPRRNDRRYRDDADW